LQLIQIVLMGQPELERKLERSWGLRLNSTGPDTIPADPEKTAEFYKRVFDMVEVGRTDSQFAEGIFLSDGTINLSVVRFKTKEAADRGDGLGSAFGLHHFGFWVENEDETRRKPREAGAEYLFTVDRPDYFEEKYKGPDAVMVDITGRGWVGAKSL
jgi:catechol 2,3-dioxygenase-like lactoylglutathione lyase family enzyme